MVILDRNSKTVSHTSRPQVAREQAERLAEAEEKARELAEQKATEARQAREDAHQSLRAARYASSSVSRPCPSCGNPLEWL
jgi:DNA repair exonuclease SbcCD ATPase subunit